MHAPAPPASHVPRPSSLGGFTLVETVVASLALAVGILAVLGAERNSRRLAEAGSRHRAAVEAAASALDSLTAACTPGWPVSLASAAASAPVAGASPPRAVRVHVLTACAP